MAKKWFSVSVNETYTESYPVYAEDEEEATEIINNLINSDQIDPTDSGNYDRDTTAYSVPHPPNDGDEYWTFNEETGDEEREIYKEKPKCQKKKNGESTSTSTRSSASASKRGVQKKPKQKSTTSLKKTLKKS